jgi:hypothetical protein
MTAAAVMNVSVTMARTARHTSTTDALAYHGAIACDEVVAAALGADCASIVGSTETFDTWGQGGRMTVNLSRQTRRRRTLPTMVGRVRSVRAAGRA